MDSSNMAGTSKNYIIETHQTFWDALISGITGGIITMRTVKVTRNLEKPE